MSPANIKAVTRKLIFSPCILEIVATLASAGLQPKRAPTQASTTRLLLHLYSLLFIYIYIHLYYKCFGASGHLVIYNWTEALKNIILTWMKVSTGLPLEVMCSALLVPVGSLGAAFWKCSSCYMLFFLKKNKLKIVAVKYKKWNLLFLSFVLDA